MTPVAYILKKHDRIRTVNAMGSIDQLDLSRDSRIFLDKIEMTDLPSSQLF